MNERKKPKTRAPTSRSAAGADLERLEAEHRRLIAGMQAPASRAAMKALLSMDTPALRKAIGRR